MFAEIVAHMPSFAVFSLSLLALVALPNATAQNSVECMDFLDVGAALGTAVRIAVAIAVLCARK